MHNFISKLFVKSLQLKSNSVNHAEVEMGNGNIKNMPRNIALTVHVEGYKDHIDFCIMMLSKKQDAILSKPWFY